ncbi:hypothetical protein N7481_006920 [Penicillium waksmanii]|uniref:uncharacterized protein n=1 Tax=Penicillium waksmanii TaxID=69791 RepID=UPI002548D2DE|nr:uncharacterized protein N7481_006920 [Penicillium waksmanii]KAJ5979622.1 hypothetical protein N7481_006920 [Penicillium waksmanii]
MIKSEPHGLTWEVVQRLITYWAYGQLTAGPKKLDMPELYALSAKYGPKGFWVEGVSFSLNQVTDKHPCSTDLKIKIDCFSPGPLYVFLTLGSRHDRFALHMATSTMATTLTLDFLEDSGSSTMRIFSDDKNQLEILSGGPLPIPGQEIEQTAMDQIQVQNVMLQVSIFHDGRHLLPFWVNFVASITPRNHASDDRLSNSWIQHLLFVLSMPDNTRRKHIGTDVGEILTSMPIPDYKNAAPPPFFEIVPLGIGNTYSAARVG